MRFHWQMVQEEGKERHRCIIAVLLVLFILTLVAVQSYIGIVEYRNGTGNFDFTGEKFTKCEMARLLYSHGIPLSMINDWVCLVGHESHFRTNVVARHPAWGSLCYGLFQISGDTWCGAEIRGGGCNITCEGLLKDVDVSISCAQLIYKLHGFHAWQGWVDYCQDRNQLTDYTHCIKRYWNVTT
uniref:lysozyme n=1 Tax=Cacopsylla melanoneura TaxID=428564 RepID=A0A8D8QA09_9HEMI